MYVEAAGDCFALHKPVGKHNLKRRVLCNEGGAITNGFLTLVTQIHPNWRLTLHLTGLKGPSLGSLLYNLVACPFNATTQQTPSQTPPRISPLRLEAPKEGWPQTGRLLDFPKHCWLGVCSLAGQPGDELGCIQSGAHEVYSMVLP